MNQLTWYLGKTIFYTIGIVLAVLAGLEFFIIFIGQLNDMGVGNFTVGQAILYTLLILPAKMYDFFPMAGLIGMLLGMGTLASNSELIVMRAAGLSLAQINWILMKVAVAIILAATLSGEIIAPIMQSYAEQRKALSMSNGQALKTGFGTWIRDGQHFLHIDFIKDPRHLEGVTYYQFDNQKNLVQVSFAQKVSYEKKKWIFDNIAQTSLLPQKIESAAFKQKAFTLSLKPSLIKIAAIEPMNMSVKQLYQTILYHSKNGLHVASYSLAFWQRLFQPVATLVMMLLAVPFIFGPLRTANWGLRLLAGISVSFGFHILNEFFGPISLVMQFPPIVAAILPSAIFAVTGIFLMKRVYC